MDDLISRQAAIDELIKMLSDCFYADEEVLDAVETTLKELPSAETHDEAEQKALDIIWSKLESCFHDAFIESEGVEEEE